MKRLRKIGLRSFVAFVVASILNTQAVSIVIEEDVSAQFTLESMVRQRASDNPGIGEGARDRIYLIVIGRTSRSTHVVKFPSFDDTYAFSDRTAANSNWISAANGGVLSSPLLWRGVLSDGDFASFVVLVGEQYIDDTSSWPEKVGGLFETVAKGFGGDRLQEGEFAAVESSLREVAMNLSSELEIDRGDEVIGIFGASIINSENQFVINFSTIKNTNIIQKESIGYGKAYIETGNEFGVRYSIVPAVSVN